MIESTELELWREQWQTVASAPAGLQRRVEQQSRRLRMLFAADVLATIVMGAGSTGWWLVSRQPELLLLTCAIWLFTLVAWIFAIASRRGIWESTAATTAAFVDLSIRRCRASLRTVTFAFLLSAVEVAFGVAWIALVASRRGDPLSIYLFSPISMVISLLLVSFVGGLLWYRRRKRSELGCLLRVQRDLDDAVPKG